MRVALFFLVLLASPAVAILPRQFTMEERVAQVQLLQEELAAKGMLSPERSQELVQHLEGMKFQAELARQSAAGTAAEKELAQKVDMLNALIANTIPLTGVAASYGANNSAQRVMLIQMLSNVRNVAGIVAQTGKSQTKPPAKKKEAEKKDGMDNSGGKPSDETSAKKAEEERKKAAGKLFEEKSKERAQEAENRTDNALEGSKNDAEDWNSGDSGPGDGPGNDGTGEKPSGSGPMTGGGSQSGGPRGHSGGRGLGGGSANPVTGHDLLLASMGGYKSSFASMGLKMGRGAVGEPVVLRSDGMPASASEVEGLKKLIRSEPQALQKRPDFYDVLPRDHYTSLKDTYSEKSGAKAFKHIGVPERRDFEWNQSCAKLSGDCNEYSRQSSYRRGEYVSPEDLWTISSALGKENENKEGSRADLAREKLSRGPYGNLMRNVLGALGGVINAVRGAGSSSSFSPGSSVWGGGGSWSWNWGSREPARYTDPASIKRGQRTMPRRPRNETSGKTSQAGLWLLLAAAAAATTWLWFVKRRRGKNASTPASKGESA